MSEYSCNTNTNSLVKSSDYMQPDTENQHPITAYVVMGKQIDL